MSLNDNVPWLTALGNDYSYADFFVRQLRNFAQPGDVVISSSVSGSSENLVKASSGAGRIKSRQLLCDRCEEWKNGPVC